MDFSLSSSLVGGAVSNPDKLALDLQFAADKTLTARKGPTPQFTRGSIGTFVGSDGQIQTAASGIPRFDHSPISPFVCRGLLIEEQRTNLVFPSNVLTTQTRTVTATSTTLSFYGTGTVVLSGAFSSTVVGSGVYPSRTVLTFTPTAGSLTLTVTGSVVFAQLEAGPFASSYIPTTTGTVVRSADVCSITSSAFSGFYNNTQGTLVTNACATGFGPAQNPVASIENGTTQVLRLRYVATTNRLSSIVSAVALNPASNYDVANTFYKAALSAGATSADFVINGTQIPDTYTGSLLTADNMKISVATAGVSNTCISSIRYYKKQLPVAKLQALTV